MQPLTALDIASIYIVALKNQHNKDNISHSHKTKQKIIVNYIQDSQFGAIREYFVQSVKSINYRMYSYTYVTNTKRAIMKTMLTDNEIDSFRRIIRKLTFEVHAEKQHSQPFGQKQR